MNPSIKARLVNLNAALDSVVEFRDSRQEEKKPSGMKKAAIAAGVLGAGAVGGTYLRGRRAIAKSGAPVLVGKGGKAIMPTFGQTLRAGAGALKGDVANAADYVGGKLSKAGSAVSDYANRKRIGMQGTVGKALRERGYLAG